MFWGWYGFNNGRRSSGCFFLPFLCLCGSLFSFTGFNGRSMLPLILIALLGLVIPAILNQGARQQAYVEEGSGDLFDGEKPKRDFDEKPKRTGEYLYRDDGDVLEVVDPPQEPVRRYPDDAL